MGSVLQTDFSSKWFLFACIKEEIEGRFLLKWFINKIKFLSFINGCEIVSEWKLLKVFIFDLRLLQFFIFYLKNRVKQESLWKFLKTPSTCVYICFYQTKLLLTFGCSLEPELETARLKLLSN